VLDDVNAARGEAGVPPLRTDRRLHDTARVHAEKLAAAGKVTVEENSLPRMMAGGAFARFGLSHAAQADTTREAVETLLADKLARSKVLHPSLTHLGLGYAETEAGVFAVMDLARVVPPLDLASERSALQARIDVKRTGNSVEPLEFKPDLDGAAQQMAEKFMAGGVTSEQLIASSQQEFDASGFALGRVTITFQVAGDVGGAVIPERTSDPALAYAGLGMAQGNHAAHEPGSIAIALFLAEPQTAHDASRTISDLPPPRAIPKAKKVSAKGSPVERAWQATLVGNHKQAAKLFEQAYKSAKKPALLYEAARAHARNSKPDQAAEVMRRYAELVEGDERTKAEELVVKLERGESIFTKSEERKLTVEAQRFLLIGQKLFEDGEWDGAIDAFQQAYTYAKHPDIIYNIGLAHVRAGRVGEALDFFAEYQKFVPEATNVGEAKQLFGIGVELYRVGQFEAASRHFAMAYGILPIPDLVYNLALCHKAMGDKAEALRLLREFLDTDPPKKDRATIEQMITELEK
jgi:tetratricopeptide (TPR) repeat protein/uncharacterized protein YkwD